MLGVGLEVWTISILFQFIEGQPCWSASWHAKMSFTLNEPRVKVICSKPPHQIQESTNHLPNTNCIVCYQLPTINLVELKDNSNVKIIVIIRLRSVIRRDVLGI
jgi:hypothetical protein